MLLLVIPDTTQGQWRRNEFESGGGAPHWSGAKVGAPFRREAPEIFLSCPSTFWL